MQNTFLWRSSNIKKNRAITTLTLLMIILVPYYISGSSRAVYTITASIFVPAVFFIIFRELKREKDRTLIVLIIISIMLRIALMIFIERTKILMESDALVYHDQASEISKYLIGNTNLKGETSAHAFGYVYFVSFIYAAYGIHQFMPKAINAILGISVGIIIYKISKRIFEDIKVSRLSAAFALFLPGTIVWSVSILKEQWVILMTMLSLYFCVNVRKEGFSAGKTLAVMACIIGIWTMRFYIAILIIPIFIYATLAERRRNRLLLTLILIMALAVTTYAFAGRNIMGVEISLTEVDARLRLLSTGGGSSIGETHDVSSLGGAIAYLPRGITLLLFAPFPWKPATSVLYGLTYPEMLIYYLLIIPICIGFIRAIREKRKGLDIIIFFLVAGGVAYSMMSGNIGTLYRARVPLFLFLYMFGAKGMVEISNRMAERKGLQSLQINLAESAL